MIGALLILAIGSHEAVLWAILPFAVLLASYAPRAISFAAGQAGFTVVLFILFNILQPVGWRVGLVRLEDIAIECAISLGVGLLFWPRGAGALLRENIAASYSRNADYVVAAERELVEGAVPTRRRPHRLPPPRRRTASTTPTDSSSPSGRHARTPSQTWCRSWPEQPACAARRSRCLRSPRCQTAARRSARAPRTSTGRLTRFVRGTRRWPMRCPPDVLPPPHSPDSEGRRRLVECVREALSSSEMTRMRPARSHLGR